jgi:uncharacterized protein (DUF1697 family)
MAICIMESDCKRNGQDQPALPGPISCKPLAPGSRDKFVSQDAEPKSANHPKVRRNTFPKARYVAFLRGINVGGKNIIRMEDLDRIFASGGFSSIRTLIQSGNVMFDSAAVHAQQLKTKIEGLLKTNLGYDVIVFIKSLKELSEIYSSDPFAGKEDHGRSKFYISFLSGDPAVKPELPAFSVKKDLEVFRFTGDMAFVISYEINGRFGFPNNFLEQMLGITATTRNWNTIAKLVREPGK